MIGGLRLGIAHHLGWAVAVTASADHTVVDRRRIELVEPGVATAPIHHEGKPLDDDAAAALVAEVRASAVRATSAALDELATALPEPIVSMSLRAWPLDFPDDIAVQRRVPYEARADSVMYRQVLAEAAHARAGKSTSSTPRTWRPGRRACWRSRPTRSCSGPGRRWVHPGPRTTGSRSRPRSSPARMAPRAEPWRAAGPRHRRLR